MDSESASKLIGCIFSGNSARGIGGGLHTARSSTSLINCLFIGNSADSSGGAIREAEFGLPIATNCIFWANRVRYGMDESAQISGQLQVDYSCIQGWTDAVGGVGNIDDDPCFAEPGYWDPNGTVEDVNDDFWVNGDYHLKSQAGRWGANEGRWTKDDVTSPLIDAGDPMSPIGNEPFPNGGQD